MKLEQIGVFLELAHELHFWRTAEKLYITQSALSRQIQALEAELGFSLFIRNKRTVKLTPAGKFLSAEWARLLDEFRNVGRQARQISNGEFGTVRIGHPGSIAHTFLPELLSKISSGYPDLRFDLIEISSAELDRALLNYKIDIGFNRDLPKVEQLSFKLLREDKFGIFVPKDHPLIVRKTLSRANLINEKFILPPLISGSQYAEDLRTIFRDFNFEPHVHIESDFGSTILSLVSNGIGISVMPVSYAANLPEGVTYIELPHQTKLYVVWRKSEDHPVVLNSLNLLNFL